MSIKTLSANSGRSVIIAIIISIIAHGALAGLLVALQPIGDALIGGLIDKPQDSVIVDVVELPPDTVSTNAPGRPSFYSDKNHSVEKETWPAQQGAQTVVVGHAPSMQSPANPSPVPSLSKGGQDTSPVSKAGDSHATSLSRPSQPNGIKAGGTDGSAKTVKAGKPPVVNPQTSPDEQAAAAADRAGVTRPNLFPSKERLGELAKTYVAEAPKGETGKVLSLNTSELRYQKYLINMKNRIENLWEYPPVAVRNGWQGSLKIDFTIKKDGTISEIKLVKSSNNPVLDDAAVTVLRLAVPFTPFPNDFEVEEITIKGEFVYIIANSPVQ